jgi:hypothetical protein
VRDHPDHLLPHHHFLGGQLAGELLEQQQAVGARVEQKAALRQVIHLRLACDLHGEEGIAAAGERLTQRGGCRGQQFGQLQPLGLAAAAQQLTRGDIAVDDVPAGIRE